MTGSGCGDAGKDDGVNHGTIANVALLHIRGGFSAGVDEAAWVLWSYIVANAITIPLSGWCCAYFGSKCFFIFTFRIWLTHGGRLGQPGNAVVCRVLQGLGGGAMMPMSQNNPDGNVSARRAGRGNVGVGVACNDRAGRRAHRRRPDHRQL